MKILAFEPSCSTEDCKIEGKSDGGWRKGKETSVRIKDTHRC